MNAVAALLRSVLDRLAHDRVARNSAFIMLSTVATSGLGYLFWLVVDHTSSVDTSGRGAALVSALQATALLAAVGAAAAMVEWLPREDDPQVWRQRLTVGLVVAAVTAVVAGVFVTVLLGDVAHTLPALRDPVGAVLFVVGAACFAVGTVLDYVAVSDARSGFMLARNVVFNGLRTPLLFVPMVGHSPDAVLASWTASAVLSLVFAVVVMSRGEAAAQGHAIRPVLDQLWVRTREMARSLVGQHLVTVAAMLVAYLLPLIVAIRLDSEDAAYFYATWMLGSVFFTISPAVSTALFAESASGRVDLRPLAAKAGRVIALLLAPVIVVYAVGGGFLLGLFGPAYAHHGRILLVLLLISSLPDAVTNIAVSVLRATGRVGQALWLNVGMLVVCLVGSWVLTPRYGIDAVGLSWLVAQSLGAAWVLLAWRRIVAMPPAGPGRPLVEAAAPAPTAAGVLASTVIDAHLQP